MFKNRDLNIIIKCNMKIVNYFDVLLKLRSYRPPYKKPNEETNYILVNSDHQSPPPTPLSILK